MIFVFEYFFLKKTKSNTIKMLSAFFLYDNDNNNINTRNAFFEIFEDKNHNLACKDCVKRLVNYFEGNGGVYTVLFFYKKQRTSSDEAQIIGMDFFDTYNLSHALTEPFFEKVGVRRIIRLHENRKIEWIEDKEN